MPFGIGKKQQETEAGATVAALVTATDDPIDNVDGPNSHSLAQTQVLASHPSGAIVGVRGLLLDPEHWLVEGMTVPVSIDPANPNAFEIDWTNVPSIQDRVASHDPSLLDPMAARLKNWDALAAAGFHEPDLDQVAPRLLTMEMASMRARLAAEPDAFARQLSGLVGLDAPDGKRRALVQIATTTATWEGPRMGLHHRERLGKHAVVLSVSLPGEGPYAVFVKSFDHKHREYDDNNPGLPALVSADDPTDIEVLWDDMGAVGTPQSSQWAGAPSVASPQAPVGAAPLADIPDATKAMMTASANRMLKSLAPAARPAIIAYYRTMGIVLDDQ
jgi:hypothetical protein